MRLHVVSWNILAPIYMKCKYYKFTACHNLNIHSRFPVLCDMINLMNADIYLFQEVTQSIYHKLKEHFPNYTWIFKPHAFQYWKESSAHELNGNVVAWCETLDLKQVKSTSLRLSNGNRGTLVTGMLNSHRVAFVSIHLDDVSDHCRQLQMNQLMKYIPKHSKLVVGGDLNDENGVLIKQFKESGFNISPPQPTYFEEGPMSIDYLMSRNFARDPPPYYYIPPCDKHTIITKFGSDHLPVTGVLTL